MIRSFTMNEIIEKWNEIVLKCKDEYNVSEIAFKTWLLPLTVYDVTADTVYIFVELRGSADLIKNKYGIALSVCITEITGKEYKIEFVDDNSAPEKTREFPTSTQDNKRINSIIANAHLNPKYTFSTFVVGGNNNFAHAASLAVAESPGTLYNPLFLYGGVGLGKTHLMHSIAHYILEHDPSKKVLYVTSETFTNELIDSLKNGKKGNESSMTLFREKYRSIDVLLLDDVQFIIGKESTQEEFFHTFNHLHLSGKQIIISSDRPPKDMVTLEARLSTRFEWGIMVDIMSPDYETRMAILEKKIELDNLEHYNIPNDVIQYIASNVKSNIRELEGSLNKLIAKSRLENKEIDIALAEDALKDIVSPNEKREVTSDVIMNVVAEHFNISVADIKSNKRNAEIAFPRQIYMYLSRDLLGLPLKSIGINLGGRDHSTIKFGADKIAAQLTEDETLSNTISIIRKKINPS